MPMNATVKWCNYAACVPTQLIHACTYMAHMDTKAYGSGFVHGHNHAYNGSDGPRPMYTCFFPATRTTTSFASFASGSNDLQMLAIAISATRR